MQLRPYQQTMIDRINAEWTAGHRNILAVLPTGTGKTVIFSRIIRDNPAPTCAIAHRQELVGQISTALARESVPHRIIAPNPLKRHIRALHREAVGRSWVDATAVKAVASVDTLVNRGSQLRNWLPEVTLWVQDEAHHILRTNKWGRAAAMLPNARGLGVTATPTRADGCGLSRESDGLMDSLVVGPPMRAIINAGYLTDYRIFAPTTRDLDLSGITVSSKTGDYSKPQLVAAVRKSRIIGDVVATYCRVGRGRLGITFATDVETATAMARDYRAAGVPAEVVSYKTSDVGRAEILRRFRRREVMQLVNVDLFGEGFDLPAVECVSFARPTQSYGLYVQQFGRGLRLMDGKTEALILDFVGNVARHGLPDAVQNWSLAPRERGSRGPKDVIPVKVCPECTYVYERVLAACPDCGYKPEPAGRTSPEFVDGDITELNAATLARMRGDIDRVDMDAESYRAELVRKQCPAAGLTRNVRHHTQRQAAQRMLRETIGIWGALRRLEGDSDDVAYRRFYLQFGIDVMSAQTLGVADAVKLTVGVLTDIERIRNVQVSQV